MHKLRLLLDSCDDFRRGCLSATRWNTKQFKSLIRLAKNCIHQKSLLQPKSWSTALCCYTYLMTCPPRFKPLLFVSVLHTIPVSMNSKGPGRQKSFTHFEHRAGKVGWEGLGTKFQSSLQNIYFPLRWFQSSLLLIYFRDGPNRCSHYTKVWNKTYPICDALL